MELSGVIGLVESFYNTFDSKRRKEIEKTLQDLALSHPNWLAMCIGLIDPTKHLVIPFYGARALLDLLKFQFEKISIDIERVTEARQFLTTILTQGHNFSASVINALTSATGCLIVKCYPEIFPEFFEELINAWKDQHLPVLLPVLTEVAVLYDKVPLPIQQRNLVRLKITQLSAEVGKLCEIFVVNNIGPMLVAVECAEQWLSVQGTSITVFYVFLYIVFQRADADSYNNRNHCYSDIFKVSLAKVLNCLSANANFGSFEIPVMQIAEHTITSIMPRAYDEVMDIINMANIEQEEPEMANIAQLLTAMTDYFVTNMRVFITEVVRGTMINNPAFFNLYRSMCDFFKRISNLDGVFPAEESVSDVVEPLWLALSNELIDSEVIDISVSPFGFHKAVLRYNTSNYFLDVLRVAIDKITIRPETLEDFNSEQRDRFYEYRKTRIEASLNSMNVAPAETFQYLILELDVAIADLNVYRCEAIIYLLTIASDLFGQHSESILLHVLKCAQIKYWQIDATSMITFSERFMKYVKKVYECVMYSASSVEQQQIVALIMEFMYIEGAEMDALLVLCDVLRIGEIPRNVRENIIASCYQLFKHEERPECVRIQAARCIGISMSTFDRASINGHLESFLEPLVHRMDDLIANRIPDLTVIERQTEILLLLAVTAQIVATLEIYNKEVIIPSNEQTPSRLILDKSLTALSVFLGDATASRNQLLGKRICELLRSGLTSMHINVEPFILTYLKFIDVFLFTCVEPCVEVAKLLLLTFRESGDGMTGILISRLASWLSRWYELNDARNDNEFVDLTSYVWKKNFQNIRSFPSAQHGRKFVDQIMEAICQGIIRVIQRTGNTQVISTCFRLLVHMIKDSVGSNDEILLSNIDKLSPVMFGVAIWGVQSEMCLSHYQVISDLLHQLGSLYPNRVRTFLEGLNYGESSIAANLWQNPANLLTVRRTVLLLAREAKNKREH